MLQSKNGFVESHVAYGYPPRSASGEFYTESQQVLAAANRHLISETGREVHSRQTPSSQRSNTRSDSSRAWPETSEHSQLQAQHSHYSPEEVYPEISRLPELSREFSSQQKNLFQQAAAMPPPMKRRSYSQPPESYSDQRITAQLALEHASSRQAPSQSSASIPAVLTVTAAAPASDIEKQKMLHSLPYQHFDGLLKKERRLCSVALFQFNEAARYLSLDAAPALFRQIAGHVGERVEVAGHFHCDFAYNLHIENDVEISSGCTILNAGPVSIGARTTIGPNVSIYTYDAIPCNSAHEPGTRRLFVASPVTIGEDCYIAGHVIITRGVTIGKGCTINAKSVVTKVSFDCSNTYRTTLLTIIYRMCPASPPFMPKKACPRYRHLQHGSSSSMTRNLLDDSFICALQFLISIRYPFPFFPFLRSLHHRVSFPTDEGPADGGL